jgi:hypothetical protein
MLVTVSLTTTRTSSSGAKTKHKRGSALAFDTLVSKAVDESKVEKPVPEVRGLHLDPLRGAPHILACRLVKGLIIFDEQAPRALQATSIPALSYDPAVCG